MAVSLSLDVTADDAAAAGQKAANDEHGDKSFHWILGLSVDGLPYAVTNVRQNGAIWRSESVNFTVILYINVL